MKRKRKYDPLVDEVEDGARARIIEEAVIKAIHAEGVRLANGPDRSVLSPQVARRMEQIEASIGRYLSALEAADRQDDEVAGARTGRLKEKIAGLRARMAELRALEPIVDSAPDRQVSLTDPDARAMATSSRTSGPVGYNVQAAVDTEHHLIVAHEVTNHGYDRGQLAPMAEQTKAAMGVDALDVLADRGYFGGEQVLACEAMQITPYVPRPLTSGAKAQGRFGKQDFVYLPEENAYRCPAGQTLPWHMTTVENGLTLHRYWDLFSCRACAIKDRCTPSRERRVSRWEHEAVIEAMQQRLERRSDAMRVRRATVEHPFGTLKAWMGATHFRMRTLEKVRTEMSLHVLAYNLKRMIAIMGTKSLMAAMQA